MTTLIILWIVCGLLTMILGVTMYVKCGDAIYLSDLFAIISLTLLGVCGLVIMLIGWICVFGSDKVIWSKH